MIPPSQFCVHFFFEPVNILCREPLGLHGRFEPFPEGPHVGDLILHGMRPKPVLRAVPVSQEILAVHLESGQHHIVELDIAWVELKFSQFVNLLLKFIF